MKKALSLFFMAALLFCQSESCWGRMQPDIRQGHYYYGPDDTYQHMSVKKGLQFLVTHTLSPQHLVKAIVSHFYSVDKPKQPDAPEILNPTQMVPAGTSINPKIVWIGHASFLIQVDGFNILTDPIFGDVKVGPFTITRRMIKPGILFKNLPHIDAIVISHNHSDHVDTQTLSALAKEYDPIIYVPEGNKALFEGMGFSHIVENTWWEQNQLSGKHGGITITCLPARHWSIRFSLTSYRKSLWTSWMISAHNMHIYFAGDTGYGPHFKEIAEDFSSIDIALMPVAPTQEEEGKNIHKEYHVDAREAVDAFIDLGAHCFIPMHYGTFFGKDHSIFPLKVLNDSWKKQQRVLDNKTLLIARCGQEYDLMDIFNKS
ncbi:MAG: MBL fold metallo-hydrolase [bacterium]|nr:MBL fold metallo-hydrolase [bacterium]